MTKVKICGITDPVSQRTAIDTGADFLGYVFHPFSPRHLRVSQAAALIQQVPQGVLKVGLFVDPTDEELQETLKRLDLDMVQLHGNETPGRVKTIKSMIQPMVNKALRIESLSDIKRIKEYEELSDWLLFDAKSPDPETYGGTGQSFDWSLLKGHEPKKPWMLAGGLDSYNVGRALSVLKPDAVDVSSGVESAPGQKDSGKIREFIKTAKKHNGV